MSSGTLYTYPDNFRAFKALIAAQYSNIDVRIAQDFVFGETNKTKEFLNKFPLGKVPAFESDDGTCIFESNAIAYYVANEQMRGTDELKQAHIIQWMSFADSEILPAACTWVFPCLGIMAYNKQTTDHAKEDVRKSLVTLDEHLLHNTFLVGERITLADICVCCTLLLPYRHVLDPSFRAPYRNVNRWFLTMINQPEVIKIIGQPLICEKMAEFDAKKYALFQSKIKGDMSKKKEKISKKQEDKPQEEIKENDATLPDDEICVESKRADPFEKYPKGCYSNEETTVSIPYFWEHFDREHWSIWFCEYKYPEELTQVFMSCNLISGMYQRLEKLRKNAFASMCLFGSDNNSSISGIWIWRGQDLAFELCDDWKIDYESYTWKKLDPCTEECKHLVEQYLAWEGNDLAGRPFNQGKIFK